MKDIDKAIRLYTLMATRCEQSGFAPRQAKVYREMIELMRGCETADEASAKIKKSKYFLAPSAALMQDRLAALQRASLENGMPDVAEVYQKKILEIENDAGAMYETGYEQTAQNLKTLYVQTWEAFADIYRCYAKLACVRANNDMAITDTMKDLKAAVGRLAKPSTDFAQLAADAAFRRLVPANDEGYARFVEAVPRLLTHGPSYETEKRQIDESYSEIKSWLAGADKSVIQRMEANGQRMQGCMRKARVIAISPGSKSGRYSFVGEEVYSLGGQREV
ncbi:hypothetical protein LJB76_01725 [Clostridia bacterium OttesenSCG-928-O13]|nr:hypothetical protein [Clostridia bacterium OttesenSCG-928-O13]